MNTNSRPIKTGEEDFIYELILREFHKSVAPAYSQKGIETFLNMLSPEFLSETDSEKFSIVAECNHQIVGILSMINISHIALLFVDSAFQGHGIGKKLIQTSIDGLLKKHPDITDITVSSSPNSLSFYQNAGFEIIENEKNENGMRYTPMKKYIGNQTGD
ncbi:MAG: GNAT family N-acetyltransferase [Desulfobacteraceae bacterium]|nr:GNAT family N-acetyltransferase [Desulfobacteraceae bacterium]